MKIEKLLDAKKNQDDSCNDENKDPQKYALVEKLICREPMPNTMVMTTANSYPYRKKTYCGGLLEYEEPVDDYVPGPGPCKLCAEEPSNVMCYYCRRKEEMKDRPFSIPAAPEFPGFTGVPAPSLVTQQDAAIEQDHPLEASGESGTQSVEPSPAPVVVSTASPLSSEYTAAGASLDVVPETPPGAAVGATVGRTGSESMEDTAVGRTGSESMEDTAVGRTGSEAIEDTAVGRTGSESMENTAVGRTGSEAIEDTAVGRTGSEADTADKFVMYSPSKCPIKLERFSDEPGGARTSSVRDDSEPDEAAPPPKRVRGGPLRAGAA